MSGGVIAAYKIIEPAPIVSVLFNPGALSIVPDKPRIFFFFDFFTPLTFH
jgi:hypothetical protein